MSPRVSVRRKDAARQALVGSLTRAGYTARVLSKTNPALDARLELPLPRDDRQLLTTARQFAAAAAPFAAAFAAHGIPIREVNDRISGFDRALHERGLQRDERVKARAEIGASFSRAMDAVAVLDVTVANCLAADPVAVAVWQHDRRLASPQRSPGAAEDASPATGPAPATDPVLAAAASDAGGPPAIAA